MNALDNLPLLILSYLEGRKDPISRYEIMSAINQVAKLIDRPYSPGAVYHSIKKLVSEKMIDFNHDFASISPLGFSALEKAFTLSPVPLSLAGTLCRILSLQLTRNADLQKAGYRRLSIEMIKNNQELSSEAHFLSDHEKALNTCRKEIGTALSRIVLELGA